MNNIMMYSVVGIAACAVLVIYLTNRRVSGMRDDLTAVNNEVAQMRQALKEMHEFLSGIAGNAHGQQSQPQSQPQQSQPQSQPQKSKSKKVRKPQHTEIEIEQTDEDIINAELNA